MFTIVCIVAMLPVLGFLYLICQITFYILNSIALSEMGKNKGEKNVNFVWIPLVKEYFFAKLAYGKSLKTIMYVIITVVLPIIIIFILAILVIVDGFCGVDIPLQVFTSTYFIGVLIQVIIVKICKVIVANKIYKQYIQDTKKYIIISLFIPFAIDFILFSLKNKPLLVEDEKVNK